MIAEAYIPSYPLNLFVESLFYYKGYNPDHSMDRFLPDCNVYVVIDLTDYPKFIYDNHTLKEIQSCRNVWFSGIRTKYITIPSGRDSEMFIINFHKGKAYPFVEMPMHELTDFVVDGELVMSGEILNIRDQLLEPGSLREKFLYTEKYLTDVYRRKLLVNPFVEYAVNAIVKSPQETSMKDLAQKAGYSQKQLIKLFKDHVGTTPKAFLRIMRFQRAIREIESGGVVDWATLALDSGYYDQAHFIHDFTAFSGFTPNQFLTMESDFTNYIAVG